jgi:hypothetical protein
VSGDPLTIAGELMMAIGAALLVAVAVARWWVRWRG